MSLDHPFAEPTAIRTNLGRYLCFVGTQSFELADYVAFAGRRRENVEARGGRWEHRCAVDAPIRAQAEGVCADRKILSCHRYSGSGVGWVSDSSALSRCRRKGAMGLQLLRF